MSNDIFKRFIAILCSLILAANTTLANELPAMPTLPRATSTTSVPPSSASPLATNGQFVPPIPTLDVKSYVLLDADTGKILAGQNQDQKLAPASTTKIMTMYIIANALAHKQLKLTDLVSISEKAWRMTGSKMFVKVGDQVSVGDLIQGIVVASGNDASVAMAEFLAGTEEAFAAVMNQQAKMLGMLNSHFTDSTGMPDPNHYSSALDLAKVARATIKYFPQQYAIYSQKTFTYNNITQPNRNRLLWQDTSVDGLKTGHTDDAGYCLVASAKRDDMRLVAVVMGASSEKARVAAIQSLFNYGFRFFETRKLYKAQTPILQERLWYGKANEVNVGALKDIAMTLPRGQFDNLKVKMELFTPLKAPLNKGQRVGDLQVTQNKKVLLSVPLVALHQYEEANFIVRMWDGIKLRFHTWFGSDETV